MNISVLGGGSWGTAIARLLSNKGENVLLYARDNDLCQKINKFHKNEKYLPNIELPNVKAVNNLDEAVKNSDILVLAVPTNSVRPLLESIKDLVNENQILVNLAKGLEENTHLRISQIAELILPNNKFVVLSGPSHAEEVGLDMPTAVVVSSKQIETSRLVQEVFSTDNFRVYTNNDLIGVEIAGAVKNIIALASGVINGLKYEDNTKAALMTRGMYEMSKLGVKLGASIYTFNGLSGMGDLIVTCTSLHSRNMRAGILIGEGISKEEASKKIGQVVEGIKTTKSVYNLSKEFNIEMPITQKLYEILYNNMNSKEAVLSLMQRNIKEEMEEIYYN